MKPSQRIISIAEAHVAGGRALVREAHRTCPYSNATRGNIGVALLVNGRGVETTSEAVAA